MIIMTTMTINEMRSKVWATVKGNGSYTWKDICSMKREELEAMMSTKGDSLLDSSIFETIHAPETIGDVTFTGKRLRKDIVERNYEKKCSSMSKFEVERAKAEIISRAEILGCTPDLSWEEIYNTHKDLQHRVCHQKREITKQIKVCGYNLTPDCESGYFTFDLSKVMDVADIKNDTDIKEWLFEVAVPYADLMETCDSLGVNLVTFDPEEIPVPGNMDLKGALNHAYKYGMIDVSTGDKYFPIGLSASKARSGGVIWLANVGDWNAMEKLRAQVLHLTQEEYDNMKKDKCVIAKFETGSIGMRTSSVINVSKAGAKLRGNNNVLKNIKCKVIPDIVSNVQLKTLEPDKGVVGEMKPFSFNVVDREYEVIYSDGSSLIKLQKFIDILHQAGEITDKQYQMFTTKWAESDYDVSILHNDEEMYKFLTSKDFKCLMQVRFFGGVKGTVIPVAEMDGDERLADVDMLVFKKSAKYISEDAPFEVINFPHKKERAQLNYQFVQSTVTDGKVLIKGAEKAFENVKDVLKSADNALKFVAGVRGLNDEGDDLLTKLANDLETEPRLITEHYHHQQILNKVEKFVKEVGYGRIPVNGAFKYIISDPVWLYHQAMGDDFESALNTGEVYCNGIDGFEAGMWRSPMIHYSEPQKVTCKDIDYLWMYKDIIVLNVKDAIAPALGGADFDGDKCLIIVDYRDDSFESDFVQQIQSPGYIVYDEGNTAPKVDNNIENRIKYYVDLSTPNRTGVITNWATCANDLMINAQLNNDTKTYNWFKRLLVRLRFAQGWEIDLPKTGVSADGPDGDMLPVNYCKPAMKPQWFVDMCGYNGRPTTTVTKDGKSIVYKGNSPMEQLHQYAEEFWSSIIAGQIVTPNTMLEVIGATLTETERNAFETVKNQVIEYERLYRNETRNIISLMNNGVISDEEQKLMFENLIDIHRNSLNSLLGGDITSDVVAYACYYASNFRKSADGNNEKVSGKRSYGWVCYYAETLALLYRNNNGMSLIALPDKEMDNVEIIDGELLIDGKFVRQVEYPDGSYSIKVIDDKPFIVVPKILPVITEEEKRQAEIAYANKLFSFECATFTAYNQHLNSEQFIDTIKANNNSFDIVLLTNGSVALCMNGLVYASIKECPSEIINKRVSLSSHSDLLFIPKAQRKTTLMKDDTYAYCKMLRFTVMIRVGESIDTNISVPETNYFSTPSNDYYQGVEDPSMSYDYDELMKMYGLN